MAFENKLAINEACSTSDLTKANSPPARHVLQSPTGGSVNLFFAVSKGHRKSGLVTHIWQAKNAWLVDCIWLGGSKVANFLRYV